VRGRVRPRECALLDCEGDTLYLRFGAEQRRQVHKRLEKICPGGKRGLDAGGQRSAGTHAAGAVVIEIVLTDKFLIRIFLPEPAQFVPVSRTEVVDLPLEGREERLIETPVAYDLCVVDGDVARLGFTRPDLPADDVGRLRHRPVGDHLWFELYVFERRVAGERGCGGGRRCSRFRLTRLRVADGFLGEFNVAP